MSAGYAPFTRDNLEVGQDKNGTTIKVGDTVRWTHGVSRATVQRVYLETNEVYVWWGQDGSDVWACEQVEVKATARA